MASTEVLELQEQSLLKLPLDELQRIGTYIRIRRYVKSVGVFVTGIAIIFITLTMMFAAVCRLNSDENKVCLGLVAAGCCQLLGGFWLLFSPSRAVLRFVAILLVLQLIGIIVFFAVNGALVLPGVVPILAGIWILRTYRQCHVLRESPPPEYIHAMEAVTRWIRAAKPTKCPDIVEFRTEKRTSNWKGKLTNDHGIFVNRCGNYSGNLTRADVVFATKEEIEVEVMGNSFLSKRLKVHVLIRGSSLDASSMDQRSYRRFEEWKKADLVRCKEDRNTKRD
jgi:hypothetical protein